MSTQKASQRFHDVVVGYLENTASCIDDLRDAKLTTFSPISVNVVKSTIEKHPSKDLLIGFLDSHTLWPKIKERSKDFILKELPVLYKNVGINVNILICPFKVFMENEGKTLPIDADDIDMLWQFFQSMVCIACNYVFNKRFKQPDFVKDKIDVDLYAQMFSFELKRD